MAWLPAVEVPVNTAYRGEMLSYIIEHSGAELAVISQKYLSRLAELEPPPSRLKTVVVPDAAGDLPDLPYRIVDRQEFLSGAVAAENLDGPGPADLAAIMYTSGTTGPSKGVMMPWGQMHATAAASIFTGDFGPDDAYYMPFPLFHISGKGPIYTFLLCWRPCGHAPFLPDRALLGGHREVPLHDDLAYRGDGELLVPPGPQANRCR